ncbi:hypothetical protein LEP48_05580 [Isoptericola sp. NEAU-Y5]|uniref:Uncharacterized protein n=1 Tax=Isoptericola luteus TaxID=2879484 RepID=A0ABS7ZCP8_9MICO|nr:hypothetical protein [Isoptericola sp. NEAU-Y5]MCA5892825.1 hypothetical protein [Isoptericola sp. NEAU-Y5]
MSFLEAILDADRIVRPGWRGGYRDGRVVGDGIEAADVAFYGPMVLRRPTTTGTQED